VTLAVGEFPFLFALREWMGARRLLRTASTRTCRTLCLVRPGWLVWLVGEVWRVGSLSWVGAVVIGWCRG
jgi:hypothetical protein